MQKLHLPISWQQPYRHISQPARPVWLSEPAARGRPCLNCGWFRCFCMYGWYILWICCGTRAWAPLAAAAALCCLLPARADARRPSPSCTLSLDCVISCEGVQWCQEGGLARHWLDENNYLQNLSDNIYIDWSLCKQHPETGVHVCRIIAICITRPIF